MHAAPFIPNTFESVGQGIDRLLGDVAKHTLDLGKNALGMLPKSVPLIIGTVGNILPAKLSINSNNNNNKCFTVVNGIVRPCEVDSYPKHSSQEGDLIRNSY